MINKKIIFTLIIVLALFTLTGCKDQKYKLKDENIKTINELRQSIKEGRDYGSSTISSTTLDELKTLVRKYSRKSWFNSSAIDDYVYGEIADDDNYEITRICNNKYCAKFKVEKDNDDYYLVDYSFGTPEGYPDTLYIIDESSKDEIQLKKLDFDVRIEQNGTVTFTETREVNVSKGTEGVNPISGIGDATIRVLSASMDGKEYTLVNKWDRNATLEDKAYKAGIYQPNEEETDIVFGISEYGNHTYKITYQITNLIFRTKDADMFYWQFEAPNDNPYRNVTIKISGPSEFTNSQMYWIFGRKDAAYKFKDGIIYASSNGPLSKDEYLVALIKFPKNTFKNKNKLDKNFEYYYKAAQGEE